MSCYFNNENCPSPTTGAAAATFYSAIQFLYTSQCLISENWPTDSPISNCETFDFIIVGAGSAGCVVANRLSEVNNWKILLLEAGGIPPVESVIPRLNFEVMHTQSDWAYYAKSSGKTNAAHINNTVYWPRGKMLGGSSSLNAMIYVRGVREDYQTWYNAGNKEWHPDIVDKYFKKAESLQNPVMLKNPEVKEHYGNLGPLVINRFNDSYKFVIDDILKSLNEIEIENVDDINTAQLKGSGIVTSTAYNGLRESTAKAYLNTIKDRKNLKILSNAFVEKILINKSKEAYGVSVKYKGKKYVLIATREVILSAGAVESPKILMLSGVGPKKHLNSMNINCKVNQPNVGQNLQDHLYIPITVYGNGPPQPYNTTFSSIQYLYNRTGPLAQGPLENIVAFYSKYGNTSQADYQIHFLILWKNSSDASSIFKSQLNFKASVVENVSKQIKNQTLYLLVFNLLHPRSRGNITLQSNNPKDHPNIYPNYFEMDDDLDDAVNGIMKVANNIIKTKYFRSIDANIGEFWEPCTKYEIGSYDYWKCISLSSVCTVYHPVGTCKMGPDPKTAVVDDHLRVHGVKKLRVIDASIMPYITTGNTNGPTVMIAERASDLVKLDNN